jgi:hypothetical protein
LKKVEIKKKKISFFQHQVCFLTLSMHLRMKTQKFYLPKKNEVF